METMYIGSGDVGALMAGPKTKTHIALLQRFVSGEKPHYNAKASPIDALRTGAILEDRYAAYVSDDYYPQVVKHSKEMDVFRASLDFAKLEKGNVVDFQELKSCSFDDFLSIKDTPEADRLEYVKKKYKKYYNQTQEQMFVTELSSCHIVFLAVYSYNDDENYRRIIQDNDIVKVLIPRDEVVIASIKQRGKVFQDLKDIYY